ncbi:MAG TPA: phosphatidylglycerophosphatase A, partial [Candidatus Tectomicrobia bacterium]
RRGRRQGVCPIKNRLIIFIATGGYSGYAPMAPGTCGSAVGLLVFLSLAWLPVPLYMLVLVACTALGIGVAGQAEQLLGDRDAAPIVIDEITGMLMTYCAVPVAVLPLVVGFLSFRLFDIYKPLPQLEHLPGGWGIMLDDLLAGLLAQLCVRLFLVLMGY